VRVAQGERGIAMIRRRYGVSLARVRRVEEDVDPNAYPTNIADCMLVLMLGAVVALITYYNVDLSAQQEDRETVGIEVNMDANEDGVIDDQYEESGRVYYDSSTGNYYFVADNEGV
jgi:hypothetical protein